MSWHENTQSGIFRHQPASCTSELNPRDSLPVDDAIKRATDIATEYGYLLENMDGFIMDEKRLPYSKQEVRSALVYLIVLARIKPEIEFISSKLKALEAAFMSLARFQSAVGKSIDLGKMPQKQTDLMDEEFIHSAAEEVTRFSSYSDSYTEDLNELADTLDAIKNEVESRRL